MRRFQWTFSGLNVNVLRCRLDSIGMILEPESPSIRIIVERESRLNDGKHLVENTKIIIRNSSFSSLALEPGAKAQIIDCYIDG